MLTSQALSREKTSLENDMSLTEKIDFLLSNYDELVFNKKKLERDLREAQSTLESYRKLLSEKEQELLTLEIQYKKEKSDTDKISAVEKPLLRKIRQLELKIQEEQNSFNTKMLETLSPFKEEISALKEELRVKGSFFQNDKETIESLMGQNDNLKENVSRILEQQDLLQQKIVSLNDELRNKNNLYAQNLEETKDAYQKEILALQEKINHFEDNRSSVALLQK